MKGADLVEAIIRAARRELAIDRARLSPEFYYSSLPLCMIDAVFSIGVRYSSVQKVVAAFCWSQDPPWALYRGEGAVEHTVSDFLTALGSDDAEQLATSLFQNLCRTSTRNGILKAEAVRLYALVLQRHSIERFGDTEHVDLNKIGAEIRAIPGQRSGLSFDYFLMLGGSDELVKPDRWVCRFVSRVGGLTHPIAPEQAKSPVIEAAHRLNVAPRLLDYAIWNYERQFDRRNRDLDFSDGGRSRSVCV